MLLPPVANPEAKLREGPVAEAVLDHHERFEGGGGRGIAVGRRIAADGGRT